MVAGRGGTRSGEVVEGMGRNDVIEMREKKAEAIGLQACGGTGRQFQRNKTESMMMG